ncbi:hypothetical protein [Pontiella sulfatireligans]|uniref:Uncharacterized protein n=1 Tax=Pontiella sulfatireligans TaxID=2750658 RepID=A0A6C2UQG7_9BACT|nr:hypothetical protein [Pontiella sulfatireligans]VGO22319.1 hypothetical protein SCARR_04402 [Pontiella sulfatireligans]
MELNTEIENRGYYLSVRRQLESAIRNCLLKIKGYARKTKNTSIQKVCEWMESPDWSACPYFHKAPQSKSDPRCFQTLSREDFAFIRPREAAVLGCPYGEDFIWRTGMLWGLLAEELRKTPPCEGDSGPEEITEYQIISHEVLIETWNLLKTWESIYMLANHDHGDHAEFIHHHLNRALSGIVWSQFSRSLEGGRKIADNARPLRQEIIDAGRRIDPQQKRSANSLAEELSLTFRIKKMIPDPQNKGGYKPIFQARKGCGKSNIRKILLVEGWLNRTNN